MQVLGEALKYIVACTEVDEEEIFKICHEFWNYLAQYIYDKECEGTTWCRMFYSTKSFFVAPGGTMQLFGGFSSGGAKSPAGLLYNDRSG